MRNAKCGQKVVNGPNLQNLWYGPQSFEGQGFSSHVVLEKALDVSSPAWPDSDCSCSIYLPASFIWQKIYSGLLYLTSNLTFPRNISDLCSHKLTSVSYLYHVSLCLSFLSCRAGSALLDPNALILLPVRISPQRCGT